MIFLISGTFYSYFGYGAFNILTFWNEKLNKDFINSNIRIVIEIDFQYFFVFKFNIISLNIFLCGGRKQFCRDVHTINSTVVISLLILI